MCQFWLKLTDCLVACIVSCVCILCWCTVRFLGDPGHGEGNLRRTILERNRCPCHESPHTVTFFSYILHYQYCRPVSDSRRPCIHRHVEIRLYCMSPSSRSFLESASACYDDCTRRTHRQFAIPFPAYVPYARNNGSESASGDCLPPMSKFVYPPKSPK